VRPIRCRYSINPVKRNRGRSGLLMRWSSRSLQSAHVVCCGEFAPQRRAGHGPAEAHIAKVRTIKTSMGPDGGLIPHPGGGSNRRPHGPRRLTARTSRLSGRTAITIDHTRNTLHRGQAPRPAPPTAITGPGVAAGADCEVGECRIDRDRRRSAVLRVTLGETIHAPVAEHVRRRRDPCAGGL
jgi:hypothetical protein